MPYNQCPSDAIEGTAQPTLTFQSTVIIGGKEASVWGVHVGEEALKRYLSCMILMHLPSEGISEAFDWLVDSWKFYAHPPIASTPTLLIHQPVRASGGRLISQSPLVIEEE
jgi:hypothetical protein